MSVTESCYSGKKTHEKFSVLPVLPKRRPLFLAREEKGEEAFSISSSVAACFPFPFFPPSPVAWMDTASLYFLKSFIPQS